MNKIVFYLFLIRFRKILSKDDYLAMFFILVVYVLIAILVYYNYQYFKNYIFLLFLDIALYHVNRTDVEFLKLDKNYKLILFLEYVIYSLPFYIALLLKKQFVIVLSFLLCKMILLLLPKINFKIILYPFQIFNAYWHISFRKYRFVYIFPLIIGLIYLSIEYNNENIIFFSFIVLTLISCTPSFERERLDEIKRNPFDSEKYLLKQIGNSIINTFYLVIPVVLVLIFLSKWEMLFSLSIIFIVPLINLLLKYVYFHNSFLQQIVFVFFIGLSFALYAVPLLSIPFLYKKAIKNLKMIKT